MGHQLQSIESKKQFRIILLELGMTQESFAKEVTKTSGRTIRPADVSVFVNSLPGEPLNQLFTDKLSEKLAEQSSICAA